MSQNAAARLFSTRNLMGVVLIAGIAAGVYLGDFLKGPGWGGSSKTTETAPSSATSKDDPADKKKPIEKVDAEPEKSAVVSLPQSPVVKVVIADRSYFLRSTGGDQPAELKQVVAQATAAKGDEDGIRVRVYRKLSSRTAAEIALRDALAAAGISDDQTVWVANPVDD